MWIYPAVVSLAILLLIYVYRTYDSINGKKYVPPPTGASSDQVLTHLYLMTRQITALERWPFCLLVALALAVPICYALGSGITWTSVGKVAALIFVGMYFGMSWLHVHFYVPNVRQLEENYLLLKDKLEERPSRARPKRK